MSDNSVKFKKKFLYYAVAEGRESFFIRIYVNKEINIMRVELLEYEEKLICEPAEFKFEYTPKSILLGKNMPTKVIIKMGEHHENEIFNALFRNIDFLKEWLEWIESENKLLAV